MSTIESGPQARETVQTTGLKNELRLLFRRSEAWFVALAALVGAVAGAIAVLISALAYGLQSLLFGLPNGERLSAMPDLSVLQLAVLPIGGIMLALFGLAVRARNRPLIDVVEANSLHGGRMSIRDSLIISGQTIISNGFGASVGLEAAYAQMGGSGASVGGRAFALRRSDFRTLVGAGAGAGIAAAFGAPLVGAFYAFEIVIGAYTPTVIAPVIAASLSGTLVANALGAKPYLLHVERAVTLSTPDYLLFALLGAVAAIIGIAMMRAVALVEAKTRIPGLPRWARPIIGGILLVPIAAFSPQTLSAGHGALHVDFVEPVTLGFVASIFLAKSAASIISLGFGFRGGLFFASLFLGTLLGFLFAGAVNSFSPEPIIQATDAALVGMAALAVAIIGGPMTMAMLILETTHDFDVTGAVLAASLVASVIVREAFGYSFSTWRLHLRGETIKSVRDVGWVKTLTAGRMMRRDPKPTPGTMTFAEFRRRFPLGSAGRVVLTDDQDRYLGVLVTADAYAAEGPDDQPLSELATGRDSFLRPGDDIVAVMAAFDRTGADELAVLDEREHVLGYLSESFARKRYAEELEKAQRELFGEKEPTQSR